MSGATSLGKGHGVSKLGFNASSSASFMSAWMRSVAFWILDIDLLRIVSAADNSTGRVRPPLPGEAGWRDEGVYSFFHSSRWP
jgi:hypothetical protein